MSVEQIIAPDPIRLAELHGLSVCTIRRLDSSGKLPGPVHIGGAVHRYLAKINACLPDRRQEGERS